MTPRQKVGQARVERAMTRVQQAMAELMAASEELGPVDGSAEERGWILGLHRSIRGAWYVLRDNLRDNPSVQLDRDPTPEELEALR